MEADIQFMQEALAEARSAAEAGEVPIGAVLVHDGKILARSGNRTIHNNDPTAHAEMVVDLQMMLAGTVVFENRTAVHAQYISASDAGKRIGALDVLFDHLIAEH